jgi:predicted DNA-binding protein (MmcQ/YjbR family)
MEIQNVINYCAQKKGVKQEFPFGDAALVMKVMNKMFCLINLTTSDSISLKCDPVYAQALRQKYKYVQSGYYMNKKHWNTIELDQSIADSEIYSWIDDSYELVVKGLKKADREKLLGKAD